MTKEELLELLENDDLLSEQFEELIRVLKERKEQKKSHGRKEALH